MKITIYELLGLIKDGKAPKEIIFNHKVYELDEYNHYMFNYDLDCYEDLLDFTENVELDEFLNDELEMIEEEKEIKHINIQYWRDDEYTPEERINVCMTTINQLIDVINDMRDKE